MRVRFTTVRTWFPLGLVAGLAIGCDDLATGPQHRLLPQHDVVPLNGITVYTTRAEWEAAVAAASATVENLDFSGLTQGLVTQLDTDYGDFRIVIDVLATTIPTFNPGIQFIADATCSFGTGDCNLFTFNMLDPTSTLVGPKINQLVFPDPIIAFGGDFIQVGVAPGSGVTGPVTLQFGTETVVINDYVNASGNGFFGFIAITPSTTISFTYAKNSTLQNELFQVNNPAYANGPDSEGPTPEEAIAELRTLLETMELAKGMATSVDAKLRAALDALAANNAAGACTALQDLINHARAQSGKHIPEGDAATLIAEATGIAAALGC